MFEDFALVSNCISCVQLRDNNIAGDLEERATNLLSDIGVQQCFDELGVVQRDVRESEDELYSEDFHVHANGSEMVHLQDLPYFLIQEYHDVSVGRLSPQICRVDFGVQELLADQDHLPTTHFLPVRL